MSAAGAVAFLDHVERDEAFADQLRAIKDDPSAVFEAVSKAGYEASPEEIREAFFTRYGAQLGPDQLEQIAGGLDSGDVAAIALWSTGLVLGAAAAAVAAAV